MRGREGRITSGRQRKGVGRLRPCVRALLEFKGLDCFYNYSKFKFAYRFEIYENELDSLFVDTSYLRESSTKYAWIRRAAKKKGGSDTYRTDAHNRKGKWRHIKRYLDPSEKIYIGYSSNGNSRISSILFCYAFVT